MNLESKSNSQLRDMLMKDSGYSSSEVRAVINEMDSRGLETPPASMVTGGRDKVPTDKPKMPTKLPKPKPTKKQREAAAKKTAMAYGGMAGGKKHMYAAGGMVKDNPGLKALKAASPMAYNKITGK